MAQTATESVTLSAFQRHALAVPEAFDVFLGGGRGGGKSYALALLALRHAEQYAQEARILYVRRSYKGIADFEQIARELFGLSYGTGARYNAAERVWRLPNGAYFELGQLDDAGDYSKYQGRSFNLLLVDEAGQYPTPDLLDRLRSNLRGRRGVPVRVGMAANPGDAGHHWLAERFVFGCDRPWVPFLEPRSGRQWVYCPSTYLDNSHIDRDEYRRQLESACPGDPELLRAWTEGDWAVARGAFFASVLSEERNATDPWEPDDLKGKGWDFFLAHDFGTSAPSVTFVCAKSPGTKGPDGRWYARDSIVLVEELATVEPDRLNAGLGWTIPRLAEEIRAMWSRWSDGPPKGAADDACFAASGRAGGTIGDEFKHYGVHFSPAHRGQRVAGWEKMRRMLEAAGKPDVPGLYIARSCDYFWRTVPYLPRDPKRANDVDSRGPDHAADACRYGLTWQRPWGFEDLFPDDGNTAE